MNRSLCSLGIAAAVAVLSSCANQEEPAPKPSSAPKLVGRIASVHESDGFVLYESLEDLPLSNGWLLSSVGEDGRTATLVVTGERMGRFAAADLKSGDVQPGDAVYARPAIAEEEDIMAADAGDTVLEEDGEGPENP